MTGMLLTSMIDRELNDIFVKYNTYKNSQLVFIACLYSVSLHTHILAHTHTHTSACVCMHVHTHTVYMYFSILMSNGYIWQDSILSNRVPISSITKTFEQQKPGKFKTKV